MAVIPPRSVAIEILRHSLSESYGSKYGASGMNEKIDCRSSLGTREMKEVDGGDEVSLIDVWESREYVDWRNEYPEFSLENRRI
jgi:hypothetical protein